MKFIQFLLISKRLVYKNPNTSPQTVAELEKIDLFIKPSVLKPAIHKKTKNFTSLKGISKDMSIMEIDS